MSGHLHIEALPRSLEPRVPALYPEFDAAPPTPIVQRGVSPQVLVDLLDFVDEARGPVAKLRRLEVLRHVLRKPLVDESLSTVAARIGTSKQFVDKLKQQIEGVCKEAYSRHSG